MVLSVYAKQRILIYHSRGYQSSNKIRKLLAEEDRIFSSDPRDHLEVSAELCENAKLGKERRLW